MGMPRHFRRSRMAPVIQSYKKVLNYAPTSFTAQSQNFIITIGQDSVPAGQTGPTDQGVPTGSVVKFFELQQAYANLSGGSSYVHYSIQLLRTDQTAIPSNVVGGSPKRNQVFYQRVDNVGANQNYNRAIKFKIPKRFQRVREGDIWLLEVTNSATIVMAHQFIYKFYR